MGRSQSFASTSSNYTPCSDSLSLRLRSLCYLTSLETVTRRLIMQKARRHPTKGLRPLVSAWFQVLFTLLFGVLFTFPSRYLFTIGLLAVFSLAGWCRQLQTGFLRPRPTQDTTSPISHPLRVYHPLWITFPGVFRFRISLIMWSFNPDAALTASVWALSRSLATTWEITVVFSSSRYLDVSVPRVCSLIAQSSVSSTHWVAPFGHLRIISYLPIPAALRSLSRPSSPLRA